MSFLTIPSPITKDTVHTITLNKSTLFALSAISSDAYFSVQDNVKRIIIEYNSDPGNQRRTLVFDMSQATPTASFKVSARARSSFLIEKIILEDFDEGKLVLSGSQIPSGLNITIGNASSGAWTPSSLSSLNLWLDADDASTITLNGSTVSQWRDKSGQARHASESNASLQPVYTISGLNSKPVVTFNQDQMDAPGVVLTGQGHEVYIVASIGSADMQGRLLSLRQTGAGGEFNNPGSWIPLMWQDALGASAVHNNQGTTPLIQIQSLGVNQANIFSSHLNSGLSLRLNGTQMASAASSSNLNTTDGLRIGQSLLSNDENWNGLVAEVIFTTTLSTSDREKMEGYLAHKWGLTAKLPSNHPYKNAAPVA